MNREPPLSEEFLNAFVDEQLDAEEKNRAYLAIGSDPVLNQRVCELRKLRDLARLAYQEPPEPPARPSRITEARTAARPPHRWARAAVVVALIAGSLLGLFATQEWRIGREGTDIARAPSNRPFPASPSQEIKVLFHVNSGNPVYMDEVLVEIEGLMRHYREAGQPARVQVIANGEGLDLLRADRSPFPERVTRLLERHENLSFAACQSTMERIERESGVIARLLPGVTIIDSGVAQIIKRQQQGWIYIQA